MVLAGENTICYVDLIQIIRVLMTEFDDDEEKTRKIKEIKFHQFNLAQKSFRCHALDNMGNGDAALILEELDQHFLTFLRLDIRPKSETPLTLHQIEPMFKFNKNTSADKVA
jgi:hypothetical protein